MDLFRRKEYSLETPEIKKWLKSWLKAEKWSIKELVQFLQENCNLEAPISFQNFDAIHSTIDCVPATGKTITLQYYRKLPQNQVRIIADDITHCYYLGISPNVQLAGKIAKLHSGSTIYAKYRYHDYTYKVYEDDLDTEYRIRLFITDPEGAKDDQSHRIMAYTDKIESYLVNAKETDAVSIYHQVCGLFDFDYKEIDNIHLTYNQKEEIEGLTITEVEVEYGRIVSCEAHNGKKTYKVSLGDETWSWEYADSEHSIAFEFTQEKISSTEQAREEIETDVREKGGYEINPEILDNVLSEITQAISKLLEIMG